MRRFIETCGGVWELFLLALRTGFRMRGPYWRWRNETAFGSDRSLHPSRRARLRSILEYGCWVYRMKRNR